MNRVYATHKSSNTSKNNFKIVCSTVTQEIKLELKKSKYPKWANFLNRWIIYHCCIRNRPLGNRYVGFSELFLPSIQCCLASLAGERFGSCNRTTHVYWLTSTDTYEFIIKIRRDLCSIVFLRCFENFFIQIYQYICIFIGANMRITIIGKVPTYAKTEYCYYHMSV